MIKQIIQEFQERHNKEFDISAYLSDYEQGIKVRELAENFGVNYNALRYLNYNLGLKYKDRIECVRKVRKDLANENGKDYDLVHAVESDLENISDKNRKLMKALTNSRDENNALRAMMRKEDRGSTLEERLLEVFEEQLLTKEFSVNKVKYKKKDNIPEYGLACIFSDIHIGDLVKSDVVPNNNYNFEIAEDRLDYFVQKIITNDTQSKKLVVYNLADNLKGIIHNGDVQGEDGVVMCIIKAVEIFHKIYTKLASHYEEVIVYHSGDNHSRLTEKPNSHNKWKDFNYLLFAMNEMLLKQSKITNVKKVFTKTGYNFNSINGHNIISFHSDTLRNYKVHSESSRSKLQDISKQIFNKDYHSAINGHKHTFEVSANAYGGMNIQNPTPVGNTEYGIANGFSSISSAQVVFFVNDSGKIEQINPIYLGHIGI